MKEKVKFLIAIFVLALVVHLIGINLIGRTWDEQYKIDFGLVALDRISAGDFSFATWNDGKDHPMVAKYIYGFFERPEIVLLRTTKDFAQISDPAALSIISGNYVNTIIYDKLYAVPYDFNFPRIISALFNTLATVFTVLFAYYLTRDARWAFLAGVFLLLTPRFVFLGQLVTFESLSTFFFCSIVFVFSRLLKHPEKLKLYILTGILCGLFFWTRYNNIIFLPFLAGWLGIDYYFSRNKKIFNWRLILIPAISALLGIAIWPILWYDFPKYLLGTLGFQSTRLSGVSLYFWKYLLFTTPIPILAGAAFGIFFCLRKRSYWHVVFLWWIVCTVVLYTISVIQLGGTRYVVIIYPVLSILCAYGYYCLLKKRAILIFPIVVFLVFEMMSIFPYYIDYYNQLIGGTTGAIRAGLDFSWWGEGQRAAGFWVNENVPDGATVGQIVTPKYVFPKIRPGIVSKGYVNEKSNANYIVVSRSDQNTLSKKFFAGHSVVFESKAAGESLVSVYKKK